MTDIQLPLRAEYNPKFYNRPTLLAVGMFGFMLYCLYDGYLTWPNQKLRGEAFMEIAEEKLSEEEYQKLAEGTHGEKEVYAKIVKKLETYPDIQSEWIEKAESEDWSIVPPEKLRSEGDILGQYVMAGLVGLVCLAFTLQVLLARGGWIELQEDEVTNRGGDAFRCDQVTAIDKKKWRDKGIAYVRYVDEKGRKKSFLIDNYKYLKKPTDQILHLIEQQVGVDKIVGGPPESAPGEAQPAPPEPVQDASTEA